MSSRRPVIDTNVGPMNIDVPRTAGYYGGIGLAVAFGLIEWPLAAFIAAIPVVKLLQNAQVPKSLQFAVHVFDGAAQPVGGDAEGTIRLNRTPRPVRRATDAAAATASRARTAAGRAASSPARSRRRKSPSSTRTPAARRGAESTAGSEPSSAPASS